MGNPMENNFVKSIIKNNDMTEKDNIPQIHHVGLLYVDNLVNKLLPQELDNHQQIGVFIIRAIHMLGIGFLMVGWLLPIKYLIWHILFCIKTLLLWEMCDDKCYMSLFISKLFGYKKYQEFVPANIQICKGFVVLALALSVQSMIFPQNSYFNIFKSIFSEIEKFYK